MPLEYSKAVLNPNHSVFSFSDGLNYTAMFLIFLPAFMFYRQYNFIQFKIFEAFGWFVDIPGISRDWIITININENIGTFWACLPGMLQKRWFTQETRLRHNMKIKNLSDTAYE